MKILSTTIILSLVHVILVAQDFKIKRIEQLNQQIVVHYDLLDSIVGRSYSMNVYASTDNFINPLTAVTGDIGLEVKPGSNKKIVWDAKADLGASFSGSVSLEIRGKVYIPFVRLLGFEDYKVMKRLKSYPISWSGGTTQNILNIDVYKGDRKITSFTNIANVGQYKMTLPRDAKPGKDYRLKISDSKNKDEVVYSGFFKVKRKTPLLLKVFVVAGVGYAAYWAATRGDDDEEIPDPAIPK